MELDRIEQLLEKYFEATTTAAEEREIRDYFSGEGIAPHLEAYQPMFAHFSQASEERYTRQVSLKTRRYLYQWISVAAVAVLMLGFYFGNGYYKEQQKAEFAYEQTRKALGLIAQNLDRGTEKVAKISEFEETKQKIYKVN